VNRVLIGIAVGLVLLIGAALAAPSVVDWNRYREDIAARVEAAVGRDVLIGGDIDFTLLPQPSLSVRQVYVANAAGASAASLVSLGSLDIKVALAPLLRGAIEVRTVVLQDPVFELELLADGRPNWSLSAARTQADVGVPAVPGGGLPSGVQIDSLQVRNGTVTFRDARRGIAERLTGVDADVSSRAAAGPYLADGAFTYRGLPIRFAINTAAVVPGRPMGVRTDFTFVPDGEKLEFRGTLSEPGMNGTLAGALTFEGKSLAALAERLARAFGTAPPAATAIAAPVRISAQPVLKFGESAFNDVEVRVGDLAAKGAVNVVLGETPRVDATVAMGQFDLDAWLARTAPRAAAPRATTPAQAPAPPFVLPALRGNVSVTVDALTYRQRLVRNLDVAATLADGTLSLTRGRAQLPGITEVDAKGQLVAANGRPQFDGEATAKSDNLRDLLTWLRVEVADVPADRLRMLTFQGRVRLRPDVLQAYGFQARIDSTNVSGAAAYALRNRPAFSVDLDVDRFDADAYLRGREPFRLATLEAFDTDVRLRLGELMVREQPIRGIVVDAGMIAGVLTLRELSIADAVGAKGTVTGIAQGFSGRTLATGTVNIAAESAAGLARLLDLDFIEAPERIGAFAFNANVDGDLDKLTVDAGALVAGVDLRLQGNVRSFGQDPVLDLTLGAIHPNPAALLQTLGVGAGGGTTDPATRLHLGAVFTGPLANLNVLASGFVGGAELGATGTLAAADALAYTLQVSARHPDVSALIRFLGLRYRPSDELGAGSLRAGVEGARDTLKLTGIQASIGEATISGTASADRSGPRPLYLANLRANALPLDRLLPARPRSAAETRSEWSNEPLPLAFLRNSDFDFDLAAASVVWRGTTFDNAVLVARGENGTAAISPASANVLGGTVAMSATVTATDMAATEVDFAAKDIDLAAAPRLNWAVVPASGRLAATLDVRAIGASEYELFSSLRGAATIAAAEGVVRGLDLARSGQMLDRLKDVVELPNLLQQITGAGETPYRAIGLTLRATDGMVALDSLTARLDGAVIAGGGTIDLPRRRTAVEMSVAIAGHPDAPAFALDLSGPWDAPRRLARSRELQGYVARRLATALPAEAQLPAPPPAPAPVPFEERMRGFLEGLARPTP